MRVGQVHVELHDVRSLLRLRQTGVKRGDQVVSHLATGIQERLEIVIPVNFDVET